MVPSVPQQVQSFHRQSFYWFQAEDYYNKKTEWETWIWGRLATPALLMKSLQADSLTCGKWCLNEAYWMGLQTWFTAVPVQLLWMAAASWWFRVQKGHAPPLQTHTKIQKPDGKFSLNSQALFAEIFYKWVKTVWSGYLDACFSWQYLSIVRNSFVKLLGNTLYSAALRWLWLCCKSSRGSNF